MLTAAPPRNSLRQQMLDVLVVPHDHLRCKALAVPDLSDELVSLATEMIATMHESDGIGLASVQVGRSERLFVVHVRDYEPRVFFNPEITSRSVEEDDYEEGCLSIPGVYANVRRPVSIAVRAIGLDGEPFELEADGLLARVIQHENDHLDGVLFWDHLSERKRNRLQHLYQKGMES